MRQLRVTFGSKPSNHVLILRVHDVDLISQVTVLREERASSAIDGEDADPVRVDWKLAARASCLMPLALRSDVSKMGRLFRPWKQLLKPRAQPSHNVCSRALNVYSTAHVAPASAEDGPLSPAFCAPRATTASVRVATTWPLPHKPDNWFRLE